MKGETGGPAFPFQATDRDTGYAREPHEGMTLRDYFAGQALVAINSQPHPDYGGVDGPEVMARDAYAVADAMLKARGVEYEVDPLVSSAAPTREGAGAGTEGDRLRALLPHIEATAGMEDVADEIRARLRATPSPEVVELARVRNGILNIRVYPYRRVYAWWGDDEDRAAEGNGPTALRDALSQLGGTER